MQLRYYLFLFALTIIIIGGCGNPSEKQSPAVMEKASLEAAPPPVEQAGIARKIEAAQSVNILPNSDQSASVKVKEKILKEAELSIKVEDYYKVIKRIHAETSNYDAYIADENEEKTPYQVSNRLVIRVVAGQFDKLIESLSKFAAVIESKKIQAKDVTEEFVDIESRLKTKKEVEKRYYDILTKAKSIDDILSVEEKIGELQEEIESVEGRLRFLSDKVNYSTISLTVTESYNYIEPPADKPGFLKRAGQAFLRGWDGLVSLAVFLINIWPLILILAAAGIIAYKLIRSRKK